MDPILKILRNNALESHENIARMLDIPVEEVRRTIRKYEEKGVIRAYQAVLNEDLLQPTRVRAAIEVKVTPEREGGFDHVARRISRFPEVQSTHLVSGGFDLLLFVEGDSLQEVASFVSEKLAPQQGITSTATHFMLKAYKKHGLLMEPEGENERLQITP